MLIDIRHNYTFKFALLGCEVSCLYRDLLLKGPWGEVYLGEDHGRGRQLWRGYAVVWQTPSELHQRRDQV